MKIGIGIPTYNRLESLKILIQQIRDLCDLPYDLFVSIDSSTDGTKEWLDQEGIENNWHEHAGIAHTKNYIIKRFKDYDYFFIIEDDVRILKRGVFGLFVRATQLSGIHHFNFLTPYQRCASSKGSQKFEDIEILYSQILGGTFSSFTKEVVRKVGYMRPEFKGYGYEHCEYTLRVGRAGLTTTWYNFAHIKNSEEYLHHEETVPKQFDPALTLNANCVVLQESLVNQGLIYVPWNEANGEAICLAIGHRGQSRIENLTAVLSYYRKLLPSVEIILVEQDVNSSSSLIELAKRNEVKYLFAYNPLPFNRSWTFNIAARQTSRSVLMCCDNDTVLDKRTINHATNEKIKSEEFDVYVPYYHFFDMSPALRDEFVQTLEHKNWKGLKVRGYRLAGGCIFVNKEKFLKCGFNEKFLGWGGEDDEFVERASKVGLKVGYPLDGYDLDLFHLHHDRDLLSTNRNPHYGDNVNELNKIRSLNPSQVCAYNKELMIGSGNLDKYRQ